MFGVGSNHNASFECNTNPIVIANKHAYYFAGKFVNSYDNVMLKNKIETVYKEYAGYVDKQFCARFNADDIKIAIAKLKKEQLQVRIVSILSMC